MGRSKEEIRNREEYLMKLKNTDIERYFQETNREEDIELLGYLIPNAKDLLKIEENKGLSGDQRKRLEESREKLSRIIKKYEGKGELEGLEEPTVKIIKKLLDEKS